jgi:hypothetical protein
VDPRPGSVRKLIPIVRRGYLGRRKGEEQKKSEYGRRSTYI